MDSEDESETRTVLCPCGLRVRVVQPHWDRHVRRCEAAVVVCRRCGEDVPRREWHGHAVTHAADPSPALPETVDPRAAHDANPAPAGHEAWRGWVPRPGCSPYPLSVRAPAARARPDDAASRAGRPHGGACARAARLLTDEMRARVCRRAVCGEDEEAARAAVLGGSDMQRRARGSRGRARGEVANAGAAALAEWHRGVGAVLAPYLPADLVYVVQQMADRQALREEVCGGARGELGNEVRALLRLKIS